MLFWAYPKLLIYLLLIIVAILGYGALYLILAARLDPQPTTTPNHEHANLEPRQPRRRPTANRDAIVDDTLLDVTKQTPVASEDTSAKKATRRKTSKTTKVTVSSTNRAKATKTSKTPKTGRQSAKRRRPGTDSET